MQRLRRFARFWDIFGNSGNFNEALPLLWREGSPFAGVMAFCRLAPRRGVKSHGIARSRQYELLHEFLLCSRPAEEVEPPLARDYQRCGGSDRPRWLIAGVAAPAPRVLRPGHAKRQQQHQGKAV